MKIEKPSLKNYLSLQHYLQDLYEYRKKTELGFSYESWAQELDFNNRSYLRQVVIGRRSMTFETAQLLMRRLNLKSSDKDYFDLLVKHSRARNFQEKEKIAIEMVKIIKADDSSQEVEGYQAFISKPLYPQLQTLLSFQDIEKTAENLAKILRKDLAEIKESLLILEKIKMAEQDESGYWKSVTKSFKVSDQIGDHALLKYHEQSLEQAIQAQSLPKPERRYKSLLLPLSAEEFDIFMSELQDFTQRMRRKFDVDHLKGRKLHQVNINLYSVSAEAEK